MKNKKTDKKVDSSIHYSGEIKVEVRRKNKTISSKNYKNEGNWPLFYFLGLCLSGNYEVANSYIPKYIKLFSLGASGSTVPTVKAADFTPAKLKSLTTPMYNTLPYVERVEGQIGVEDSPSSTSVTFKFLIPYSQISNTSASDPVNMFVLYDQSNKNSLEKPSAYFVVRDEDYPTKLGGYEVTDETSNDYNLFIQWVMTIKN